MFEGLRARLANTLKMYSGRPSDWKVDNINTQPSWDQVPRWADEHQDRVRDMLYDSSVPDNMKAMLQSVKVVPESRFRDRMLNGIRWLNMVGPKQYMALYEPGKSSAFLLHNVWPYLRYKPVGGLKVGGKASEIQDAPTIRESSGI